MGSTVKVKVKPNSGEQEIEKISEDSYVVKIKAPPEDGKANLELLKILKKYFKKEVRIKRGFTSREKVVEILD